MSIFIQIASQRDPELGITIRGCLENASKPENLRFGICHQFSETDAFWEDLKVYENDERFRILHVPFKEARGACWARHAIQELQQDERQTLQIDSHMRFSPGWDTTLIEMTQQLQDKGFSKPLITAQAPSQDPKNDPAGRKDEPWRMAYHKFTPEGCVFFMPEVIPNWKELDTPVRARFYSAHFAFTIGAFCREVMHDPEFQFHGEEISITVRAQTHGQDLFHPHKPVVWHEQTREGRTKQWDDDPTWHIKNEATHAKNRKLLMVDKDPLKQSDFDFSKQGLGTLRTLRDQERYAGLCFGTRSFHPWTLDHKDPPNPSTDTMTDKEWLLSFSRLRNTSQMLRRKVYTSKPQPCTPNINFKDQEIQTDPVRIIETP